MDKDFAGFGTLILDVSFPKEKAVSPVRTVTRKEVVPGYYGHCGSLSVSKEGGVHLGWTYGQENIREIISLLSEIADALEEQNNA